MEELKSLPFASIIAALEYQAEINANRTALLYPDPKENFTTYASLNYKQYNNLVNHLAVKISEYLPISSVTSDEKIVCGLLGSGGTDYLLAQLALLKLPNVVMFPISPRNSQAAVEHLIRMTNTRLLLTFSSHLPMIETIREQEEFESLKVLQLDSDEFHLEQLLIKKDEMWDVESSPTTTKMIQKRKISEHYNDVVIILHSSGSTAHPKPIYLTNRYFFMICSTYASINKDFWSENDVLLVWGALFHLMALHAFIHTILTGCTFALPLCVSFPPKPEELIRNIRVTNSITVLMSVPSLLEQLARDLCSEKNQHIGLKPLINLRFVFYGGASCPDEICRTLVDHGVTLLGLYGSTETGIVLGKNFNPYDKRWKYMQFPDNRKAFVRMEPAPNSNNPNEKLFVYLPNDPFLAENIANRSDGSYTLGDIVLEDPPNSGQYIILGRQDDTLVHVNGEKTNPVPMEEIIRCSPLVKQVAIVGHNQFCTAALIQLNISEASKYEFQEIEDKIWRIIEQANVFAPSHSRLIRSLVKILPMNRVLPVTDKGNLMRGRVNMEFLELISSMYEKFLTEKQQQQEKHDENVRWTKEKIEKYLKKILKSLVNISDDLHRSIFEFGINSLQVLEIRNFICQDICPVPKTFVYEYSSIEKMTKALLNNGAQSSNDSADSCLLVEEMIEKYTDMFAIENNINDRSATIKRQDKRIFLVTGANGSLGCFIIRDLLRQPTSIVKRIYCLLRGPNAKQRMYEAFEQRHLDINLLTNALEKKQPRLVILSTPTDLNNEITDIIHSAWKMNFNQTLKDFEHDCIHDTFNLLKFAGSHGSQFHFMSSIASTGSGVLKSIAEQPFMHQTNLALPLGYGQSKYVAEHLCWSAMDLLNVPVNIYRLGQICGDTENGIWNTTEMTSMMIYAGAGQLKKLPDTGDDIRWIPVDICSASVVELALKSSFDVTVSKDDRVYHLLNPHVTIYDEYLHDLQSAGLQFDSVSSEEFLQALSNIDDQTTNPLVKLYPFLEHLYNGRETSKFPRYEMIKTLEKSEVLKQCPRINSIMIERYLAYWKECGLLN